MNETVRYNNRSMVSATSKDLAALYHSIYNTRVIYAVTLLRARALQFIAACRSDERPAAAAAAAVQTMQCVRCNGGVL